MGQVMELQQSYDLVQLKTKPGTKQPHIHDVTHIMIIV